MQIIHANISNINKAHIKDLFFFRILILPQFGIRIVHKKVGSLTNILYLYR